MIIQFDLFFLLDNLKNKKYMNFTGNENHEISLNEAAELTQRFRDNLQKPVKLTTLGRFKLTTLDRFKLTTLDRSKLTTNEDNKICCN
jgi:hypothetical protein